MILNKILTLKTFDELEIGAQGQYSKTLTERDIVLFGEASGDLNPVHFDDDYASKTVFKQRVGHGMWSAALISACIGTVMPGPGSLYLGQTLSFKAPARLGDVLTATLTIKAKLPKKILLIDCEVCNQDDQLLVQGEARVLPPRKAGNIEISNLPDIQVSGLEQSDDRKNTGST